MNDDFLVYKTDEDKKLVFGWASVSITVDGEVLEDRQHDMIDPEDLEEAAYSYVLNFRDTGEEHRPELRQKGKLVESCVFTQEKQKAMGIPEGILPVAWWVGFKIEDDEAWEKVKTGTYRMFSIEGKANREKVEKSDAVWKSFNKIIKYNPYHDRLGRFSSGGGSVSFRYVEEGKNPISDITGYAMFADNQGRVSEGTYGSDLYVVRHEDLTDIENLKPKIAEAWDEAVENDWLPYELDYMNEHDGKTIAEAFDPKDIVDSAEAWDEPALISWAWDIGIFDDVIGVKTRDGAVVFDESIISRGNTE